MKKNYPLNDTYYYEHFPDFIEKLDRNFHERTAITYFERFGNRVDKSYAELTADVRAFGEALCMLGLQGKHIAIVANNSYEWIVAFFAIACCGSVAILTDTEQPDDAIDRLIRQADGEAIITCGMFSDFIEKTLAESGGIQTIVLLDSKMEGCKNFWELVEEGKRIRQQNRSQLDGVTVEKDQVAAIAYTSGTTSAQKPVMLGQYGMLLNACEAMAMVSSDQTMFTSLPFYHTYGLVGGMIDILSQGKNLGINGDLKTMVRDMAAFRPENMMAVPAIVEMIHQKIMAGIEQAGKKKLVQRYMKLYHFFRKFGITLSPKFLNTIQEGLGGRLNMIICGGAYLDTQISLDLLAFGIQVLQGYGITECSPLVSVNRNKNSVPASCGRVFPSYQVQVLEGEICVKGPSLMKGYYKREDLTRETFEGEWFLTGDLGYLDKRGYLYITGRKKSLIVFKNGKKSSPEEIEQYVQAIPEVKEVLAYGTTSGISADDVQMAVMIYPDPEKTLGMQPYEILERIQERIDVINDNLPSYKQIRMITLKEKEFEKTATRKIKRSIMGNE